MKNQLVGQQRSLFTKSKTDSSKNLSNENKHTLCFQRIGILITFCLSLLRFFDQLFDVIIDDPFWHCEDTPLLGYGIFITRKKFIIVVHLIWNNVISNRSEFFLGWIILWWCFIFSFESPFFPLFSYKLENIHKLS